jgi:D-3-phosphoglycerate dehydrogenase
MVMIRILASDGLDKSAAKKLCENNCEVVEKFYSEEELARELNNYDVLIVRSATKVTRLVIDAAAKVGRLKLVIRAGVGMDNIDVKYAQEKGIKVMNTPKASSASVAELTIAHMFSLARFVGIANVTLREGKWEKKAYKGIELLGKTLGLVGFGRIAKEVAKRANALGMNVIYTDILGKSDGFDEFKFMTLEEILKNSDFLSVHVPFIKENGALIKEEQINMMKDGSYIINCARGGVISETALLKALNTGKLSGAGLDVFEQEPPKNLELIRHPRVSVTPHIGASTAEAQKRIGMEIVSIILK